MLFFKQTSGYDPSPAFVASDGNSSTSVKMLPTTPLNKLLDAQIQIFQTDCADIRAMELTENFL